MSKYVIRTYAADGHGHESCILGYADTLREARTIVREYLGLKRVPASRRWHPGSSGGDHYAPEAYHAYPASHPKAYGCGGVAIVEAASIAECR